MEKERNQIAVAFRPDILGAAIVRWRVLIEPRTRRTLAVVFRRPRIPRKTLGRNLNKSFTVEEPATIGRAEHGNDLALNADVTNFLGCPHNLPFKSSPHRCPENVNRRCGHSRGRCQINGNSRSRLSERRNAASCSKVMRFRETTAVACFEKPQRRRDLG